MTIPRHPLVAAILSAVTFGIFDLIWLNEALVDSTAPRHKASLGRWWLLLVLYCAVVLVPLFYLNAAVQSRTQTGALQSLLPAVLLFLAAAISYSLVRAWMFWSIGTRLPTQTVPPVLFLAAAVLPPLGMFAIASLQHDLNRADAPEWATEWQTPSVDSPAHGPSLIAQEA